MTDAIESIGPVLGIAAFLGLAFLVFLLFQQARDIRRLREWAGRAPERAKEAAEASLAAAEARGEVTPELPGRPTGRMAWFSETWRRAKAAMSPRLNELDRRSPIKLTYLVAGVLVVVVAAAALTSGFGIVGGDGDKGGKKGGGNPGKPAVAVLNGTSTPNLAATVGRQVVEPAGYRTGAVTNTPSSVAETTAMYAPHNAGAARALATAVRAKLGETPVSAMTADIRAAADGAPLALVIGLDDAEFGGG